MAERQEARILVHLARFGVGVRVADFPRELHEAVREELDALVARGAYHAPSPTMGLHDQYVAAHWWSGYSAEDFT